MPDYDKRASVNAQKEILATAGKCWRIIVDHFKEESIPAQAMLHKCQNTLVNNLDFGVSIFTCNIFNQFLILLNIQIDISHKILGIFDQMRLRLWYEPP